MESLFDVPVLPYSGTSGWSGSDTSEQRARTEDANGTTGKRQQETFDHLNRAGMKGLTWKELSELTGWHHGQASGVLSVMHKAGLVERLTESRNKCEPYVLVKYVFNRPTSAYRAKERATVEELENEIKRLQKLIDEIKEGQDGN